ncbi:hypothetical protein R3P38DRAFT_2638705 [Favolaschia claudopus]|uniref:F-box domain-containing protein n=1 Tax=Favolaschia claudopus TaxID=2862362 RepID=A0AAW0AN01_9AGAR
MKQNPLNVPELLDHAIGFLGGSAPDLAACALVARPWVDAAQRTLLRTPHVTNHGVNLHDAVALRFHNTLTSYPHLVRHIRELCLQLLDERPLLTSTTLELLCHHSYTHLESFSLSIGDDLPPDGLRRIFSLPTLRHIALYIHSSGDLASFAEILEECSQSVKHFELSCGNWDSDGEVYSLENTTAPRIKLKSVWLDLGDSDLAPLLGASYFYPFDFSNIEGLQVGRGRYVPWRLIPKRKIRFLHVGSMLDFMDLSSFINLELLQFSIQTGTLPTLFAMLDTLPADHRVHTIALFLSSGPQFGLTASEYADLDAYLADPRFSRVSTLEVNVDSFARNIERSFPSAVARGVFRSLPRDCTMRRWCWLKRILTL